MSLSPGRYRRYGYSAYRCDACSALFQAPIGGYGSDCPWCEKGRLHTVATISNAMIEASPIGNEARKHAERRERSA